MTANWPIPAGMAGSQRTAARFIPGAISLSSSSHFPLKLYSNCRKPVALPPGRDRLLTKPEPTGSGTIANTIGTVRVAWSMAPTDALPVAKMRSGASAANSVADLRMRSASTPPQRKPICRLRPLAQSICARPRGNAEIQKVPLPDRSPAAKISINQLVGAQQSRGRQCDTERLGGLEIDDDVEFCRTLDGPLGRTSALENFVHESAGAILHVGKV